MKSSDWGMWANPDPMMFRNVCYHSTTYNNIEWHLGKTYSELISETIVKNPEYDNVLSTVLSDKYFDPGHIKRVDFIKNIENRLEVHVWGSNIFCYKTYKGQLPYHQKDDAMFPYKYVFNAENNSVDNYFTEKLIDAILSESLCFYWGCPNVEQWINPKAYVKLDLDDIEGSLEIIQRAMIEDWWSMRISIIKGEKYRILNELQFFPRLESIVV